MDALPRGHFGCILADPPWAFRTYGGDEVTPHRTRDDHYSTLTLDTMKALPVRDVAAPDCALFMWIVGSHLDQAVELAKHWGFEFATDVFYWAKSKRRMLGDYDSEIHEDDQPDFPMGMGYWSRKQVEPCWLFTRGRPRRLSRGVRQLIIEPRREHSRKPASQYARIEALVDGPRLELFARTRHPGWTSWGNQTDKFESAA